MVNEATRFRDVLDYAIGGGWGSEVQDEKNDMAVSIIRGTDFVKMLNGQYGEVPSRFESSSKVERRKLEVGDIILEVSGGSPTRGQTTGRTYLVTEQTLSRLRQPVIPASFCRLVRVDAQKVLPRFAYYWLQDMYSSGRAGLYENQSTGISNFQFERFLDAETIALPPHEEQRVIAETLGAFDDRIDNLRQTNASLEAIAQALFKSWFVDFDGVPPDGMQESELGLIPEGWRIGTVDDLATVSSGKRPENRIAQPTNDASVAIWGGNGPIAYTAKSLSSERILLTGRVGTLGSVFRISEPCWPSDNTLVLQEKLKFTFDYLFFQLRLMDIASLNRGSTQPLLTQSDLKSQRVVLPPEQVLSGFDEVVASLFQGIEQNSQQAATLAALRDTLLPRLISGKVRVDTVNILGLEAD